MTEGGQRAAGADCTGPGQTQRAQSFNSLLVRDYLRIRTQVRARVGGRAESRQESDDIVGEMLIRLLERKRRFDVTDENTFRDQVHNVVEYGIRDQLRALRKELQDIQRECEISGDTSLYCDPPQKLVVGPESVVAEEERRRWIRFAVELLPAESAQLVRMRHWDDLTFAEIGERLGINAQAARQRLNRIMPKLARILSMIGADRLDELLLNKG